MPRAGPALHTPAAVVMFAACVHEAVRPSEGRWPVCDPTSRSPQPDEAPVQASVLDEPEQTSRFTRWTLDASGRREGSSSLRLSGITCAACAAPIEAALRGVAGVSAVSVNAAAQRAVVRWDPALTRPSALVEAVRRA
eukprot:gene19040-26976_t